MQMTVEGYLEEESCHLWAADVLVQTWLSGCDHFHHSCSRMLVHQHCLLKVISNENIYVGGHKFLKIITAY
jgi:hypothetical protein